MKKSIIILLVAVLFITGCGKSKTKKDIIKIDNSGWTYKESTNGNYLSYAVNIKNNDSKKNATNIKLTIIGLDDKKKEIFKYEDEIGNLSKKESTSYGKTIKVTSKPSNVKFKISSDKTDKEILSLNNIKISNLKDEKKDSMIKINGTIDNKGKEINKLLVSVIFKKDKKIIGGTFTNIYSIKNIQQFEIYFDDILEYDDYEIKSLFME